jgi:hypothetical protein
MVLMGARKGVRTICSERGFDLKGELKLPALREWLAAQEDFAAVKPEIQIFLESHSHVLVFNPKCTPETTWCELGWALPSPSHPASPRRPSLIFVLWWSMLSHLRTPLLPQ